MMRDSPWCLRHLSPLEQTTRRSRPARIFTFEFCLLRSTDGSLSSQEVRFAGESAGIEALESKMAELKQQ
eukprot:5084440-Pleurochrysis_carterae.AAC.1